MQVIERNLNGVLILDVSGEIDLHNAPKLRETVEGKVDAGNKKIIINLMDVGYIDSSGIGVLIAALSKLNTSGGKFCLYGVQTNVMKVFSLTRLDAFFKIFENDKTYEPLSYLKTVINEQDSKAILIPNKLTINFKIGSKKLGAVILFALGILNILGINIIGDIEELVNLVTEHIEKLVNLVTDNMPEITFLIVFVI